MYLKKVQKLSKTEETIFSHFGDQNLFYDQFVSYKAAFFVYSTIFSPFFANIL
jgi:hypothetical protein